MKLNKVIHWPKRLTPDEDMHKLQGEFTDDVDTFAGHQEYRPDCVTHSGLLRGRLCCELTTFDTDPMWYISQYQYGLPGDFNEDAGV